MIEISVILCTYSPSSELLKENFTALFKQDLPGTQVELIVIVNNPFPEPIVSEVKCLYKILLPIQQKTFPMKVFVEHQVGLSYARNTAVQNAKGNIIVFIDDDMIPSPNWLSRHWQIYEKHPDAVAVGGDVKGRYETSLFPKWLTPETKSILTIFHLHNKITRLSKSDWLGGGNISFRKRVFDIIGYFRTDLGRKGKNLLSCEDTEFTYRLQRANIGNQYYDPLAYVYHYIPKWRLTKEYNRERWYWQGISEAYFDLICYGKKFLRKRWLLNFKEYLQNNIDFLYSFFLKVNQKERFLYELRCLKFIAYSLAVGKIVSNKIFKYLITLPSKLKRKIKNRISVFTRFRFSPQPRTLHYEVTYCCNCRCKFCSRWKTGPSHCSEELSTKEAIRMISEAKRLGIRNVCFSGGEPFMRKDLFKIASFCKEIGLHVLITTNGTFITEDNIEEVISLFDDITISIDSNIPEEHDQVRGVKGTFNKAIHGLLLLPPEKRVVQCLVTSKNLDSLPSIAKYFNKLGARIVFQPIHSNPNGLLILSNKQLNSFGSDLGQRWGKIRKEFKEMGFNIEGKFYRYYPAFWTNPNSLRKTIKCYMGSAAFFIEPYGNVVPCEEIRKPLGNIRKESLLKIWKSKQFRNFRVKYNIQRNRPCVCLYNCVETNL